MRKSNKDTVLHLAVRRRDVDLARMFVDFGVQVDAQNVSQSENSLKKRSCVDLGSLSRLANTML